MPFKALALMLVLPVLAACSATSDHDMTNNHEGGLMQDVRQWAPALDANQLQPTNDPSDPAPALMNPAQAQALALQQSPAIRSILASQGIADARYRQATLIRNPGFSASALRAEGSGNWKTEFGISFGILDWLTHSMREELAGAEFESAQAQALNTLTMELGNVRTAYFAAVASRQASSQQQQTAEAARLNAELARLLSEAGNLSELERLHYDNELARQNQSVKQTQAEAAARLAELKLAVGLTFNDELIIPEALPDTDDDLLAVETLQALLQDSDAFAALLANTTAQRPEVRSLRNRRQALEHQLSLHQKQFGMSEIGVGFVVEREPDGSNATGIELDFSLPIFDRGQTAVAAVMARHEQLTADEQSLELVIAHQLRTSLNNVLSLTEQLKQLRDTDIPRYQRMLALVLEEYNFMLSGPFDLISAKQEETEAVARYITLLEHYWMEYADLMQYSANTVTAYTAELDPVAPASRPPRHTQESDTPSHQEHHHD